jgi:hypothetical protein
MLTCADRLAYYDTECCKHLSRVRLSHLLALDALGFEADLASKKHGDLIGASFGNAKQDVFETKLRDVLHEVHLVFLKTNFELFLNRLLSTIWTFHFVELTSHISDQSIPLSELAAEFLQTGESRAGAREFIIDKIVPSHGLDNLESLLQKTTKIRLREILNRKDFHFWPQINTAFEVRHLMEHRDGKVDRRFRSKMAQLWVHSSWGARLKLEGLEKIASSVRQLKKAPQWPLLCAARTSNRDLPYVPPIMTRP